MLFIPVFSLMSSVVIGCAHAATKDAHDKELLPPTTKIPSLQQQTTEPKARNERWWWLFNRGETALVQKKKEIACPAFRTLSSEKDFPLKDLATLRALEICPGHEDLTAAETLPETSKSWFRESDIRARDLHYALLPPAEKVDLLWDKAALEKSDRQRELYLSDAVSVAEAAKDPELIQKTHNKLWNHSPRLKPRPSKKDLPAVANDYRRWRDFNRSLAIERERLKDKSLTFEERFNILKSIRQTYKIAQRKNETLKATQELVRAARREDDRHRKSAIATRLLLEAEILLARTVWTENQRSKARAALENAKVELWGRASLEEIFFILGRMSDEEGKFPQAIKEFDQALAQEPSVPGLRDKIQWARAWVLYKQGPRSEAAAALGALASSAKEPGDQVRAAYWQARATDIAADRKNLLMEVRAKDPLGFYGLLTYRDLGDPIPPLKTSPPDENMALWVSPDLNGPPALTVEWLLSLNLTEGVARILNGLQSELQKNRGASEEAWMRLASAYARAGEFMPLFALMGTLPPERRDRLIKERPDLLFPIPYRDLIEKAARESSVPPEMIYAIIRQESAFNPHARSPADAFGLTQLLPSVAGVLAKEKKIPFKEAHDLYDPETSIRLGSLELKRLLGRWKEQWIPAVACYNANEPAVKGWLKNRGRPDVTEFIEEIPYEETRAYIKLVMRNQIFYRRLLQPEAQAFPENCLKIAQAVSL